MAKKPIQHVSAVVKQKETLGEIDQRFMQYTAKNENVRALATKLIDPVVSSGIKGRAGEITPDQALLLGISRGIQDDLTDIENVYAILPDTEVAEQVMVSSILSPADMMTEELFWSAGSQFPADVSSACIDLIRTSLEKDYSINEHLAPALRDALYRKGSYPLAIFPESAIDEIIRSKTNTSLEDYQETAKNTLGIKGLIGTPKLKPEPQSGKISTETYFSPKRSRSVTGSNPYSIHNFLSITDNPAVIKAPLLQRKWIEQQQERKLSSSLESFASFEDWKTGLLNPAEADTNKYEIIGNRFYQKQNNRIAHSIQVNDSDDTKRGTIGTALIRVLPHESVIPVFVPGEPSNHIGYFVLLDGKGNFLTKESEKSNFSALSSQQNIGVNQMSAFLSEMRFYEKGSIQDCKVQTAEQARGLIDTYISAVEKSLITSLTNGIYGDNVDIGDVRTPYFIMLTRALLGLQTQVLFMPETLVQYVAFDYNNLGIGVSLITRCMTLAALRSVAIYANQTAMVKNAIPRRIANLKIDPRAPNPWEIYEQMLTTLAESNAMRFMYHSLTPESIENSLAKASWEIVVEGHPDIPEHRVDIENKSGDRAEVNTDILEDRSKAWFSGLKVPPGVMDATTEADFAAQILSQNALFRKTSYQYAKQTSRHFTEIVRKISLNDGYIIRGLATIFRDNFNTLDEYQRGLCKENFLPLIKLFLEDIEVSLPVADAEITNQQMEAFNAYKSKVEEMVPLFFSKDDIEMLIPETDSEEADAEARNKVRDRIEDFLKSLMLRKYVSENNIFPEVNELFGMDTDEPTAELAKIFATQTEKTTIALQDVIALIWQRNQGVEETEEGSETESSDSSSSDDSSDDSSSSEESSDDSSSEESSSDEDNSDEENKDESEEESSEDKDESSEDDSSKDEDSNSGDDKGKDEDSDDDTDDLLAGMPEL